MRLAAAVLILVFAPGPLLAQSPCDGRIKDKLNHPMSIGAVAKPAAGRSYIDPVFGTKITRITNSNPADGANAVTRTLYSTVRGWNADGSMIVAWTRGHGYNFYKGDEPYTLLGNVTFGGDFSDWSAPADIEQLWWDPINPNVMWYPAGYDLSGHEKPRLMKMTLRWPSPPTFETYRDFAAECAAGGADPKFALSLGNDPSDMSTDGSRLMAFTCGSTTTGTPNVFIMYSATTNKVLFTIKKAGDWNRVPPWALPSGKGFYHEEGGKILNLAGAQTGSLALANYREHAALASTLAGYDTYNLVDFDTPSMTGSLVSYRLDTGVGHIVIGQKTGWPYPKSGTHVSTGAMNGSGWVAVGQIGTATGQTVLDNEIVLANVYTDEVCRVAHARTYEEYLGSPWDYWGETHPQISNDGYRILFTSDWLGSSTVDMYVIDLRRQPGPQPTPTPPPPPPQPPPITGGGANAVGGAGGGAGKNTGGSAGGGAGTNTRAGAGTSTVTGAEEGAGGGEVSFGGGGENGYSFAARTPVQGKSSAPSTGSISKGVAGTAGPTTTSRASLSSFLSSRSAGSSNPSSKGIAGTVASQAFVGGFTDLKAGRYESAEQKLLHAIEADPRSAAAHYYLGYTYYLLSRKEPATSEYARKAAESIAQAFRIDPTFKPTWGKEAAATQ